MWPHDTASSRTTQSSRPFTTEQPPGECGTKAKMQQMRGRSSVLRPQIEFRGKQSNLGIDGRMWDTAHSTPRGAPNTNHSFQINLPASAA